MLDKQPIKVVRMPKSNITESYPPAREENGVTRVHVDFYSKAKNIPLWERGGRRAFAKAKGQEFGTDQEFDELFKAY